MKSIKSYALLLITAVLVNANGIAKSVTENNIPANVLSAFAAKYPNAAIKNWNIANGEYIAKAKDVHHKYFAVFDDKGNWVRTSTKLNWPWSIPAAVKSAFKKTKYGAWHIYGVNIVDKPSGQFYQLLVDDANPNQDKFQNVQTTNCCLEFKANGGLVKEINTNTAPTL